MSVGLASISTGAKVKSEIGPLALASVAPAPVKATVPKFASEGSDMPVVGRSAIHSAEDCAGVDQLTRVMELQDSVLFEIVSVQASPITLTDAVMESPGFTG